MNTHPERSSRRGLDLLDELITLADDCRATTVAADARRMGWVSERHLRELGLRLRHHLYEHQLALAKSKQQTLARVKAFAIANAVSEQRLERALVESEREGLAHWLVIERTKFLMSSTADALGALELRLAGLTSSRATLRTDASREANAIAVGLLDGMWQRTTPFIESRIAATITSLYIELEQSLADLGESVMTEALMVHIPPLLGSFRDEVERRLPTEFGGIADRFGFGTRGRILSASRNALREKLATGTQRIVFRMVEYYNEAIVSLEERFGDVMHGVEATIIRAGEFADTARRNGPEGVAFARRQLVGWSAELRQIIQALP